MSAQLFSVGHPWIIQNNILFGNGFRSNKGCCQIVYGSCYYVKQDLLVPLLEFLLNVFQITGTYFKCPNYREEF